MKGIAIDSEIYRTTNPANGADHDFFASIPSSFQLFGLNKMILDSSHSGLLISTWRDS
jgi:hypothetical protein